MTAKTTQQALTGPEIDALVTDAQAAATDAADALAQAEAVLRGEQQPAAGAASITPALLAELRQNAEHAALLVPAAERQQREARAALKEARTAATRARIRAEAESDLDGAAAIIAALDAFEAAVDGLCGSIQAHNTRIARWDRLMGEAGIAPIQNEGTGPGAMAHMVDGQGVALGHKLYRPMRGAPLIAAVIYRALASYPRDFRLYNGALELVPTGDLTDSNGQLDLRAMIRKDA